MSTLNVLIAEDNPANQLLIEACCRTAHVNPTVVANGAIAVETIASGLYDLVLMDVHMPVMDGITATREIRKLPGRPGQTLIFGLTADMTPRTRGLCLAAGMQEVMPKPLRLAQLSVVLETVRNALARRPPVDEVQAPEPPPLVPKPKPGPAKIPDERLQVLRAKLGTKAAARIFYLDLQQVKEKLGSSWSRIAERVEHISRLVIEAHLDAGDYFEQADILDYLIGFSKLDAAAGELRCEAIAKAITRRLFGEEGSLEFDVRTVVMDLEVPAATADPSIPRGPGQPAPPRVILPERAVPTEIRTGPLAGLTIRFEPVWDVQKGRFPMQIVRPVFASEQARTHHYALQNAGSDDGVHAEQLDFAIMSCFARASSEIERIEETIALCLDAHFTTLAKPGRRARFVDALEALPAALRQRLIIGIWGLPRGLLEMRLAEIQSPLRGRCLNVMAAVDVGYRDFALLRASRIMIARCELDTAHWQDRTLAQSIPQFGRLAQRAGIPAALTNAGAPWMTDAGSDLYRYISGPAVPAP